MARILIIEDSPLVVQMLTMVCEMSGHEVQSCELFGQVESTLLSFSPEVILTDLNLPDVPGKNAVEALRELQQVGTTPIIIISGRPRSELEEIAEQFGAQGALSKDDGMPAITAELPPMIDGLIGS